MFQKLPIVGVMGSGQRPHDDLAAPLGAALATMDVHLLTGGGAGVMTSVTKAFVEADVTRKGFAIGIVPSEGRGTDGRYVFRDGYPNPYVEIPIMTPLTIYAGDDIDVVSRNNINIMTANAVIALPGSGGTRNEINLAVRAGTRICLLGPHDLPADFHPQLPRFAAIEDALNWLKTCI